MKRIAVAIVHGVEIDDPHFADTPIRLLREGFAEALGAGGPDPEDALVVEPVPWAGYLEERERILFDRLYPRGTRTSFDAHLTRLVERINLGSVVSLVELAVSTLARTLPGLSDLHYPTARWMMAHFVGDAIAYDRGAAPENYAHAHEALARGLASLARRAGDDAPLCILAHSFGTVLVTDYLYDQQCSDGRQRSDDRQHGPSGQAREEGTSGLPMRDLVSPGVRRARGNSRLARGETLTWLYTMGSPLALWSLRYPQARLDSPAQFPGRDVPELFPGVSPEWVNLYDKDDLFAYPLRELGSGYANNVTEDRPVRLRGFPVAGTPLVHPFYWTERRVVNEIARSLAGAWSQLNDAADAGRDAALDHAVAAVPAPRGQRVSA